MSATLIENNLKTSPDYKKARELIAKGWFDSAASLIKSSEDLYAEDLQAALQVALADRSDKTSIKTAKLIFELSNGKVDFSEVLSQKVTSMLICHQYGQAIRLLNNLEQSTNEYSRLFEPTIVNLLVQGNYVSADRLLSNFSDQAFVSSVVKRAFQETHSYSVTSFWQHYGDRPELTADLYKNLVNEVKAFGWNDKAKTLLQLAGEPSKQLVLQLQDVLNDFIIKGEANNVQRLCATCPDSLRAMLFSAEIRAALPSFFESTAATDPKTALFLLQEFRAYPEIEQCTSNELDLFRDVLPESFNRAWEFKRIYLALSDSNQSKAVDVVRDFCEELIAKRNIGAIQELVYNSEYTGISQPLRPDALYDLGLMLLEEGRLEDFMKLCDTFNPRLLRQMCQQSPKICRAAVLLGIQRYQAYEALEILRELPAQHSSFTNQELEVALGYRGLTAENFNLIVDLPEGAGPSTLNAMVRLKWHLPEQLCSYDELISPILSAQSLASFSYLENMSVYFEQSDSSWAERDLPFFITLSRRGTSASNVVASLVIPGSTQGSIYLPRDGQTILDYHYDVGVASLDLFEIYRSPYAQQEPGFVEELQSKIDAMKNKIYNGQVVETDLADPIYAPIEYHMFQPAIGLTQTECNNLVANREDRHSQVSVGILENGLQYYPLAIDTGHFVLNDGEQVDLSRWKLICRSIKKVNTNKQDPPTLMDEIRFSKKLANWYIEGGLDTDENKQEMYEFLYRLHLGNNGGTLNSNLQVERSELLKYKEFVADAVQKDLIKRLLTTLKEADVAHYQKLLHEVKKKTHVRNPKRVVKTWMQMSKQIRQQNSAGQHKKAESTKRNLARQMQQHSVPIEYLNVKSQDEIIELLTLRNQVKADPEAENDLVTHVVSSAAVGKDNVNMYRELEKFSWNDSPLKDKYVLKALASKQISHRFTGFNKGECVAVDDYVWDNPDYTPIILWDKQKIAQGGVNTLIVHDGNDDPRISLPGINPSLEALKKCSPASLLDNVLIYSYKLAKAQGLSGDLLIPTNPFIHSNRQDMQSEIQSRNFSKTYLEEPVVFSKDPYYYEYDECFVVPESYILQLIAEQSSS